MHISNDQELKTALDSLSGQQRRQAAVALVQQAFDLSNDPRVKSGLEVAARANASDAELAVAAAAVNSARVASYTQCGHDTNWANQAGHFVARAAQVCVKAEVSPAEAWEAAMQARMARICQHLAVGEGTSNQEAEAQYRVLEVYLRRMKGQT
jgi:hypothetical protein